MIHSFIAEKISDREGTLIIKKDGSGVRRENTIHVIRKKSNFVAQIEKQTSEPADTKPVNKVRDLPAYWSKDMVYQPIREGMRKSVSFENVGGKLSKPYNNRWLI